jgi:hypothetical protein
MDQSIPGGTTDGDNSVGLGKTGLGFEPVNLTIQPWIGFGMIQKKQIMHSHDGSHPAAYQVQWYFVAQPVKNLDPVSQNLASHARGAMKMGPQPAVQVKVLRWVLECCDTRVDP